MGGRVTLRWIYTHMIAEYARPHTATSLGRSTVSDS